MNRLVKAILLSLVMMACQNSMTGTNELEHQELMETSTVDKWSAERIESTTTKSESPSGKENRFEEVTAVTFTEDFNTGSKTSYTTGSVSLGTGSWTFADALLGTSKSDRKTGSASARIRGNGYIQPNSPVSNGVGVVSLGHGKYGSDANTTWVLQYSTDGSNWVNAGSVITATAKSLKTVNITVNQPGTVYLRIQKTDGTSNRLNIDNVIVNDYVVTPPPTVTEVEPNDNRTSANAVSGVSTQTGLISVSTDVDYFSFPVINAQDVALNLDVPSGVDYDLYLVDSNGSVLASSEAGTGLDESIQFVATSSDTYYAAIQSYSGSSTTTIYTLGISVTGEGNTGGGGSGTPSTTLTFTEGFEGVSKGSYAAGAVTTPSGSWYLNDALIGNLSGDKKMGLNSARIRNTGSVEMQFDNATGIGQVIVLQASYGTDGSSTWQLEYSNNSGSTWVAVGSVVTTTTSLSAVTFDVNQTGSGRIRIVKLTGGPNRVNIDDIQVYDYNDGSTGGGSGGGTGGGGTGGTDPNPTNSVHLTFGNPSDALTDIALENNYLLVKDQYVMSYNRSRATANWVSWHLDPSWIGSATRQDDFRADNTLPSGWYQVGSTSYSGSGFDRGHMCPSADRTETTADNSSTFLMTNMIPQAPDNNQGPWAQMENYLRSLVTAGNEVYIIAGGYGVGGSGSAGYTTTINNGNITVPSRTWKVAIVLPQGTNDVSRVTSSTRIIAVDMPNTQGIRSISWGTYRTTVDAIEASTGLDLLELIDDALEASLESQVDNVSL